MFQNVDYVCVLIYLLSSFYHYTVLRCYWIQRWFRLAWYVQFYSFPIQITLLIRTFIRVIFVQLLIRILTFIIGRATERCRSVCSSSVCTNVFI
jgi:hypothetical protein